MKLNETVEDLNLADNEIQSFGLKMICASLLSNSTITKLNLSGRKMAANLLEEEGRHTNTRTSLFFYHLYLPKYGF